LGSKGMNEKKMYTRLWTMDKNLKRKISYFSSEYGYIF